MHRQLPGVTALGPLDVEEHLASDYGCGLSSALVPHMTGAMVAMDVAYGIFVPLVFVIAALLLYVRLGMEKECTP